MSVYRRSEQVKLVRAYGGCLGANSRRRTQQAAKSHGELQASIEPWISEWGNPAVVMHCHPRKRKGTRGTETSKYPEEKKSNEIPAVAASVRGRAQTVPLRGSGVEDRQQSSQA